MHRGLEVLHELSAPVMASMALGSRQGGGVMATKQAFMLGDEEELHRRHYLFRSRDAHAQWFAYRRMGGVTYLDSPGI